MERWKTIKTKLEEHNLNFTELFTVYLYYIKASNPETTLHNELLDSFKKDKKSASVVIYELSDFNEKYIEILNEKDKRIYGLINLKHRIYWISILTTAKFLDRSYYEELKEILLSYYYQNWISGGTTTRIKQTSFSILSKIKEEGSTITEIKKLIEENKDKYRITKSYEESLNSPNVYVQSWLKPLLLLLEYFYKTDQAISFIPSDRKLQVEHILPQTATVDWKNDFNEEEISKYTDSLGNLTLLSGRKNSQADNDNFQKKKEVYKKGDNKSTSFEITRQIFDEDNWTPKDIKDRREKLITKLKDEVFK